MACQTVMMVHGERDGHNYFTGRPFAVLPRVGELVTIDRDPPSRIVRIEHSVLTEQDLHIIRIYVEQV